jgi:hypothetical protein
MQPLARGSECIFPTRFGTEQHSLLCGPRRAELCFESAGGIPQSRETGSGGARSIRGDGEFGTKSRYQKRPGSKRPCTRTTPSRQPKSFAPASSSGFPGSSARSSHYGKHANSPSQKAALSCSFARSSVFRRFSSFDAIKYLSSKTMSRRSGLASPTDAAQGNS